MKRSFLYFLAACAIVLIGCNGAVIIRAPRMSCVVMDISGVTVFWERNDEIEGGTEFAGYNVYVYTDSSTLVNLDGEDLNKFNGQVVTDTMFHVHGLSQDSIYYFQVRSVNIEDKVGGYNDETPFMSASPRPEFEVALYISFDPGSPTDSCAIRFYDALIVADSLMGDSAADMWIKASGDTVWVVSPSEYPGLILPRETMFANIGSGDFDSIAVVTVEPNTEDSEVTVGEMVIGKTQDENYVKMRIEAIDTINGTITILYAYQNVVGFAYF
ncbi:MAG: fibronectin type III domain-containing protein [candidate division WOR-3 bacterium]|nr:MAG: fibronectin type III domain-containing protein [candidate division WOR-3 bacterium]